MLIAELTFKIIRSTNIPIDLRNKFNESIAVEAHKLGDALFREAQRLVPYDTGNLEASAKLLYLHDGFRITYDTDYAYPIHAGESIDETMTGRNYVAHTRIHQRRLPSGKRVTVRAHKKTYKAGYKPMLTSYAGRESWKTVDVTKEYRPEPWVTWAWEHVVSMLQTQKNLQKVTLPFTAETLKNNLVIELKKDPRYY